VVFVYYPFNRNRVWPGSQTLGKHISIARSEFESNAGFESENYVSGEIEYNCSSDPIDQVRQFFSVQQTALISHLTRSCTQEKSEMRATRHPRTRDMPREARIFAFKELKSLAISALLQTI
jgi:hypothetical protein